MNRTPIAASAALILLALAGCSTAADADAEGKSSSMPSATPSASTNADACDDFAALSQTFAEKIVGGVDASGTDLETYEADVLEDREAFDMIGLQAEGDVSERVAAVVDEIPTSKPWTISLDPRPYSTAVTAVTTACDAEGHAIQAATITGGLNGS
jgi:hypothetical protein